MKRYNVQKHIYQAMVWTYLKNKAKSKFTGHPMKMTASTDFISFAFSVSSVRLPCLVTDYYRTHLITYRYYENS